MYPWASTAPALTFHPDNLALRNAVKAVKMLKMQIDPAICMKTKGAHDKMTCVLQKFVDIVCTMTRFFCFRGEKIPKMPVTHDCVGNTVLAGCWVLGAGGGSDLPELAPISPIQK